MQQLMRRNTPRPRAERRDRWWTQNSTFCRNHDAIFAQPTRSAVTVAGNDDGTAMDNRRIEPLDGVNDFGAVCR